MWPLLTSGPDIRFLNSLRCTVCLFSSKHCLKPSQLDEMKLKQLWNWVRVVSDTFSMSTILKRFPCSCLLHTTCVVCWGGGSNQFSAIDDHLLMQGCFCPGESTVAVYCRNFFLEWYNNHTVLSCRELNTSRCDSKPEIEQTSERANQERQL